MLKNLSPQTLILVLLDLLALTTSFAFASELRTGNPFEMLRQPLFYAALLLFPVIVYTFDLYYPFRRFQAGSTAVDTMLVIISASILFAVMSFADRSFMIPRPMFLSAMLLLGASIFFIRLAYENLFQAHLLDKKVLLIGTGELAIETVRMIERTPHSGLEVAGLVGAQGKASGKKAGVPIVGTVSDLISLIDWYGAKLVVLAMDEEEKISELEMLGEMMQRQVSVTSAVQLFERLAGEIPHRLVNPQYLVGLIAQLRSRPYLRLKRLIDLAGAAALLLVLSPVLLFAITILAFAQPREIFFLQERIGRDGKPFRLIKLRSMTQIRRGTQRVTGFGYFLRRYRIDEFPQLINVLKGDMSLIGPRPEIPYFVARCRKKIPFYDASLALKPGLTGWAQVRFHHTVTDKDYDHKFRFNLYYLKNISLALDLLIILKTVRVVVLGKGK